MPHRGPLASQSSRELEASLVERCSNVARGLPSPARDEREANVYRLAAMVVGQRHRAEARRLLRASEDYFADHPAQRLQASEVVRRGWVTSLPRLRELLAMRLHA